MPIYKKETHSSLFFVFVEGQWVLFSLVLVLDNFTN